MSRLQINGGSIESGVTLTCPIGIRIGSTGSSFGGGVADLVLNSVSIGGTTTHSTGDIQIAQASSFVHARLNNCKLGSATEVASQTSMSDSSYICSSKHDQTAGNHKTFLRYGTVTIDTAIFGSAAPSVRIAPNNASNKVSLRYTPRGTFKVAVLSGQAVTVSLKVRESVVGDGTDYNGNRIRLILLRNDSIGITADAVIATGTVASEGAFETISGTTAAPTDDGVMEFIFDGDGTTGWINAERPVRNAYRFFALGHTDEAIHLDEDTWRLMTL